MSQPSATATIEAISTKLPEFYANNPDGWFINAEAQFAIARITDERTKFFHAVRALDPKTSEEIQHFLNEECQRTGENATPYSNLKKKLLSVFGRSKTSKMAELLGMHSFNENGAESTLRRMRVLCTDIDTMLQCKLLSMASASTRTAVSSLEFETAEELAKALDQAMEKERFSMAINQQSVQATLESTSESVHQCDISAVTKRLDSSRNKDQLSSKQFTTQKDRQICFYHERFGLKARKCSGSPCKFAALIKSENAPASR